MIFNKESDFEAALIKYYPKRVGKEVLKELL